MHESILIVDDEPSLTMHLSNLLRRKGYEVSIASTAAQAREMMTTFYPDVALMDLHLPDANGVELISEFKENYPDTRYIVLTAYGTIKTAVESTRRGAVDFLTKPFEPEELLFTIKNAMKTTILSEEVKRLRLRDREVGADTNRSTGECCLSESMQNVLSLARRAAAIDSIVLLLGESGVGKDHLANWIHNNSPRAGGPYFAINCAAVSTDLAESELFGHEPGAFTGTRGRKRGMLELAEGGTILLDEIGEMQLSTQSKLLTFLDTKSFIRVGGERKITVNTRILAATNRNLAEDVKSGRFRKDLFYRLDVMNIEVPPLRRRTEDIPCLANELLVKLCLEMGKEPPLKLTPSALKYLSDYQWPGNIRELRNALEKVIISSTKRHIIADDFNLAGTEGEWHTTVPFPTEGKNLHDVTQIAAKRIVAEALRRAKSKSKAAKLLGISRDALNYQIKSLGLRKPDP